MPVPKLRFKDENGKEYPEWGKAHIGDIGTFFNGLSGKTKVDFIDGNEYFIPYMNVYKNAFANINQLQTVKIKEGEKQNRVNYGDILFTQSSETVEEVGLSSVWLGKTKPFLNSFCFGLRLLSPKDISSIFMGFAMRAFTVRKQIMLEGQGISRINISPNRLRSVNVPVPSLPEQEKIADFLSSYDRMIDVQSQRVEAMKTRKKGLLQKIFSQEIRFKDDQGQDYLEWQNNMFGEVIQRKSKTALSAKDLPGVEYEDIISGAGRLNKNLYEKESGKKGIVFSKGDVLYGKLRPYLKNWLLPNFNGVAIGDFWVLTSSFLIGPFLYYFLQSDAFAQVANTSIGTKMPRADWKLVQSMTIKVPSLSEQQKIADFLTAVDTQIEVEEKRLETMKTIKKGLLQQMFI